MPSMWLHPLPLFSPLIFLLCVCCFVSHSAAHNVWRLEFHEVTTTLFVVPPKPNLLVNSGASTTGSITQSGRNMMSTTNSKIIDQHRNLSTSYSNMTTGRNANSNDQRNNDNNKETQPSTDPIEKLFNFFFGEKESQPLGFKRTTVETAPEFYPATTTRFAAPVVGDTKEVSKYIRPLLAQTYLEKVPVTVAYDANSHGWDYKVFHKKVRDKRSALVVAKDQEGNVFGGFNPKGWVGLGDERSAISSFLFTYRGSNPNPVKLIKIGGADMAVIDREEEGIRFGYEDLWIRLNKNYGSKIATSKLGLSFAGTKGGLFGPSTKTELVDLKVYTAADPTIWQDDNWKK